MRAHRLGPPGTATRPATLRLARRGARLAAGLRLPLVSLIDTAGAELSARAEEDGLAGEIAAGRPHHHPPGPARAGAGGAALALLPADRVLAAQYAWPAPLAPEGVSGIVYRDTGHAPELAARQRIRSADLATDGIVDWVIAEMPAGADRFCRGLGHALHRVPEDLVNEDDDTRLAGRLRRYRHVGVPSHRRLLPAGPWPARGRPSSPGKVPAQPAGDAGQPSAGTAGGTHGDRGG